MKSPLKNPFVLDSWQVMSTDGSEVASRCDTEITINSKRLIISMFFDYTLKILNNKQMYDKSD